MSNEIAVFNLVPRTLEEAMQYAKLIAESEMVPKDFRGKPGNVLIAVQLGAEIGLKPMQALQNIAVINGRPCVWGDALPALAKQHPLFEYINETFDDANLIATCKIKRKGEPEQTRVFSIKDAMVAGYDKKDGPWKTNPKRMLQIRARSFAIRDVFPDAVKGLSVAEEILDVEVERVTDEPAEKAKVADTRTAKLREAIKGADRINKNIGNPADVAEGELVIAGTDFEKGGPGLPLVESIIKQFTDAKNPEEWNSAKFRFELANGEGQITAEDYKRIAVCAKDRKQELSAPMTKEQADGTAAADAG